MLAQSIGRLRQALDTAAAMYVEVFADDVLDVCAVLPADEITRRLTDACAGVVPTTSGRRRREAPTRRVWLGQADLAHLVKASAAQAEGGGL